MRDIFDLVHWSLHPWHDEREWYGQAMYRQPNDHCYIWLDIVLVAVIAVLFVITMAVVLLFFFTLPIY